MKIKTTLCLLAFCTTSFAAPLSIEIIATQSEGGTQQTHFTCKPNTQNQYTKLLKRDYTSTVTIQCLEEDTAKMTAQITHNTPSGIKEQTLIYNLSKNSPPALLKESDAELTFRIIPNDTLDNTPQLPSN